jgi:hypothetical protein
MIRMIQRIDTEEPLSSSVVVADQTDDPAERLRAAKPNARAVQTRPNRTPSRESPFTSSPALMMM